MRPARRPIVWSKMSQCVTLTPASPDARGRLDPEIRPAGLILSAILMSPLANCQYKSRSNCSGACANSPPGQIFTTKTQIHVTECRFGPLFLAATPTGGLRPGGAQTNERARTHLDTWLLCIHSSEKGTRNSDAGQFAKLMLYQRFGYLELPFRCPSI